jgi:flagellar protein FlaI
MATVDRSSIAVPLPRGRPVGDRYAIDEPPLADRERAEVDRLRERLFDGGFPPPPLTDPGAAREALIGRATLLWETSPPPLDPAARGRVLYYLARDLIGFGPIDVAMADPDVEDISCDGVGIPIYVHHRRFGSLPTDRGFPDERELDRYVTWLAQRAGAHLSLASPLLEATLPGGARLQASLGRQVTTRGSTFTIRRFSERPLTPVDLMRYGTASPALMAYLWLAIEAGESFMVCGGTASGKTTTLNAALQFVPSERKVVSIEDTRELNLPHENWVPLVTRLGTGAASATDPTSDGAIDMFDLLAAALRQRPQYLAVGEVRGREAYTVFQAMATGKTCLATFHAESVAALVHRMESPPIGLPRALIAALPLVLLQRQVVVGGAPARRVQSLTEIAGRDPETDELVTSPIFEWDPIEDRFIFTGQSRLLRRLVEEGSPTLGPVERELDRRAELLQLLATFKPDEVGPGELSRWLAAYAREPDGAMTAARSRSAETTPSLESGRRA